MDMEGAEKAGGPAWGPLLLAASVEGFAGLRRACAAAALCAQQAREAST